MTFNATSIKNAVEIPDIYELVLDLPTIREQDNLDELALYINDTIKSSGFGDLVSVIVNGKFLVF